MEYLDETCAWLIFLAGISHIVVTEIFHPRGVVLDTGLLWVFVAMFNLLRIRNSYTVKLLKVFCLGANVSALMFEIARWQMSGRAPSVPMAALDVGFVALFLLETVFSLTAKR
jgi:hypothetical protein